MLESILIARYLLDCEPAQELQERYEQANRLLFGETTEPELRFLHRHPWALPFLDAGAGLLRPESIVRKKIFLMTAILEATTAHAEFFLQGSGSAARLVGDLIWQGLRSALKITIGIPVFILARRIG